MDIPAAVLEVLKCNSCELYLSRGPVYLQHDGAAVCGRCFTPKLPAIRNKQYEATAKMLKFPCKNRDLGCQETVPFVGENEMIAHEEMCEHRQYVCPVLGSARCDWLGPKAAMLEHCRAQHPDHVLDNPCNLIHDIARASLQTYIISAFQLLFLLHAKVCLTTGNIFHSVRLLGGADKAANYHFTLDIKRNDLLVSKPGCVSPQGCLAIQEDTSLAVNTNSLLDMLNGFDGTSFTVTVKQRVSDVADQLARAEKCVTCGAEVNVLLYRDEEGYRCKRCIPARQACNNQANGCTYTDYPNKCLKHEWHFCQQRTECYICKMQKSQTAMSAHYEFAHKDITHAAGSTWWVSKANDGEFCLVSSAAVGTAVCYYSLTDSQFHLNVRISVSSERLCEYRCTIRVTDPSSRNSRIFTPDALYNDWVDWNIILNKTDLPFWNVVFDICVDITKI